MVDDKEMKKNEMEDKASLERYEKMVVAMENQKVKKVKKEENNIFKKDIGSIAGKIRLVFILLAILFLFWTFKDSIFKILGSR